ncbi:MAG: hypothetical protein GEV11_28310 [Streptosporangiales bacterium]|nr:hypothetical protein [Streptosporangiales bacterium]
MSERWNANWPGGPPVAHELKSTFHDRWVRFHSLYDSKRHPENEAEYQTLLHRHDLTMREMFPEADVYVITTVFTGSADEPRTLQDPTPLKLNPEARRWAVLTEDLPGGDDFRVYAHLYAARRRLNAGAFDLLLRAVADEKPIDVLVADVEFRRVYHPYDGGADCLLESPEARDKLKAAHPHWLSPHSHGL